MSDSISPFPGLILPNEAFSALIFDCDGTLVDTARSHLSAYNHALSEYGLVMPPGFYRPRFGLPPRVLLAEFAAHTNTALDLNGVVVEYTNEFLANMSVSEIRESADLARAYRGKVPMAVASNGQLANVRRTLEDVGLLGLFDEVVAIEDVARGKPAPDLYLEAARRLRVDPKDCIVFEDTDEGLQAAHNAGMRARDVRPIIFSSH